MNAEVWLIPFAFFASFLIGLTGIGAGSVFTSGLILFFGISPLLAVGTSLAHNFVVKTVGSVVHLRKKSYELNHVKWLVFGAVPSAILFPWLVSSFPFLRKEFDLFLQQLIGVLIIVAVCISFFQEVAFRWLKKFLKGLKLSTNGALFIIGFVVGGVVGLTSVGSGPLVLLGLLFIPSFPPEKAVGTTIIFGVFISLIASLSYAFSSFISWNLLLRILLGSVPGIVIGSSLVGRINPTLLKKGLLVGLFVIGLKLVVG
jgi:hypothetical protein